MEALRSRRAAGADLADEEEEADEAALPLSVEGFWELGQPLSHFKTVIKPPTIELPILKRLGQPSFVSEDLAQSLGPAYRAISEAALKMTFADETETPER